MPETIGSICYLSQHYEIKDIDFGFVVTTVGGPGSLSYKQSWNSDHFINTVTEKALSRQDLNFTKYSFDIHGIDENNSLLWDLGSIVLRYTKISTTNIRNIIHLLIILILFGLKIF